MIQIVVPLFRNSYPANTERFIPNRSAKNPSRRSRSEISSNSGQEESHRVELVRVDSPAVLDGWVIQGLLPTSQTRAVRKTQVNGLHPGWPFFKEKLDGALVLLGVIGAGGIDEHATRLEEVEGPKEQRPLEHH